MKTVVLFLGVIAGMVGVRAAAAADLASIEAEALADGQKAWSDGRWLEARNAWTRYLAWERLAPDCSKEQFEEITGLAKQANEKWLGSVASTTVVQPTAVASSPAPKHRRASRRRAEAQAERPSAGPVLEKARAARKDGQLERSLHLYKLAEELPGGETAASEAADVEREMTSD